tara:strand:- start:21860 stop:22825 length:966 start_codon:yes stop_codon:yes gene_type:complete
MAVPNSDTFSLQDVVNEIVPTTDDLVDCVADAVGVSYDSTYYTAPATSLLEFRNYGAGWGVSDIVDVALSADIGRIFNGFTQNVIVGLWVDSGGTRIYTFDVAAKTVAQLSMATANDVTSTISAVDTSGALSYTPREIVMNPAGTKAFIMGTDDTLREHAISTAWDITTMSTSATSTLSTPAAAVTIRGIAFNDAGTKLYMCYNNVSDNVFNAEWALGTGFLLSSAGSSTHSNISSDFTGDNDVGYACFIKESGDDILISGGSGTILAYRNGYTSTEFDGASLGVSERPMSSSNDDYIYRLRITGTSPNVVWKIQQLETKV